MTKKEGTSWFDELTEILGCLQIMLSYTLVGLVLGALFYLYSPDKSGIVIGTIIATTGLLIGIIWASKIKKKYGTIWFISRIMATPELDTKTESSEENKK